MKNLYRGETAPVFSSRHKINLAVIASLFTLLLATGCDRTQLTDAEYLEQGRSAFLSGDFSVSNIQLKNALLQNPNNAEARYLLGRIYLEGGVAEAAKLELSRASQLGFNPPDLIVYMARANLLLADHDAVLAQSPDHPGLDGHSRALLHALHGHAHIALRNAEGAQTAFDAALSLVPAQEMALLGRVRLALAQGRVKEAHEHLETALERVPDSEEAHLMVGDIAVHEGRNADAEQAYGAVLRIDPHDFDALGKRALVRVSLGTLDLAKEDLQLMRRLAPKHSRTLYVQGMLSYSEGRLGDAREVLEELIARDQDNENAVFLLGVTSLKLGNTEHGITLLERTVNRRPGSVDAIYHLANAYLRRGEWTRARELVSAGLRSKPDEPRLLAMQVLVSLAEGRTGEALVQLRQAAGAAPDNSGLQLALGIGLLQIGEDEQAIEALDRVDGESDTVLVESARALAHLRAGDPAQARLLAEALIAARPDEPAPLNLLGYVEHFSGRSSEARAAFESALQIAPGNPTAAHNLAVVAQEEGDLLRARALYGQVLDRNPAEVMTLRRLGLLEQRAGDRAAAEGHLTKALELDAGAVDARVALAAEWFAAGDANRAMALLEAAPLPGRMHPALLGELAKIQVAVGMRKESIDTLRQLVARVPSLGSAWLQLGILLERDGRGAEAADAYSRAGEHRGRDALFDVTVARGLMRVGQTDLARELYRALRAEHPEDPNVEMLRGWMEQQDGRHAVAAEIYARQHEVHASRGTLLPLADALAKSGDMGSAVARLRSWLKNRPDDVTVGIALAQLHLDAGEDGKALDALARLLEHRPDDAGLMNDIALLLRHEDPSRATVYARRAVDLSPDSPVILDTLAVLLLDSGSVREALDLLTRAVEMAPENTTIRLHHAQALLADNAFHQGRAALEQLIARYPDAPERDAAARMLEELPDR
jgi:putative PEP-CTERM system TPR-repeat lipoprotein